MIRSDKGLGKMAAGFALQANMRSAGGFSDDSPAERRRFQPGVIYNQIAVEPQSLAAMLAPETRL
jgi:hypothetical protein